MPFNGLPKAVAAPDGFGQARIHHLDPEGRLLFCWGRPGSEPGELNLTHSLVMDALSWLIVVDRENHRLQVFGAQGAILDVWTGFHQSIDICVDHEGLLYVAGAAGRISILSMNGRIWARWGESGTVPGQFASFLHGVCVDSRGDLYVADESRLQKCARV